MTFHIRQMSANDYEQVLALWQQTVPEALSGADSRENIAAYLERNPGMSLVATCGPELVGAVLCGHGGGRGYLHHLAVAPSRQNHGIGTALVDACLSGLRAIGIGKCHTFVFAANTQATRFWNNTGWAERTDLKLFSRPTPP